MSDTSIDLDFSGLKALFLNCSLKPSRMMSHTDGLINVSKAIMEKHGVSTDVVRVVDLELAPGVQPDMTEEGFERDDWPELYKKVLDANILIVGTPIWLGEKSSVATRLVERLYSNSAETNDAGQGIYYGRVGGCIVTGNEDGIKHVAMNVLYSLGHVGYTIPPNVDCGWIGEAGPGKSYRDEGSGGPQNEFTQRNTTFMTWNLMHFARMLQQAGGVPAYGNQMREWSKGENFDHPNPEYRSS